MADSLTTFRVSIVYKSVSLDLLEPSGPVQACNGTALPLRRDVELSAVEDCPLSFVRYCLFSTLWVVSMSV
jgi:hypothetical protein